MGCGLGKLRVSSRQPKNKSPRLEVVLLSKEEVDYILGDPTQKKGTFVLYQNVNNKKQYLAFKTKTGKIEQHVITPRNDLFYMKGFPFPYMEAIVYYYQRHRFDGTLLTDQAFIEPYLSAHKRPSRSPPPTHVQSQRERKVRHNKRKSEAQNYRQFKTM